MPSRRQIARLADAIAASFDVERIILFGSRARGTANNDSDVDLLVVMRYAGSETDQAVAILSKTNPRFAVDLLVRTPADTARVTASTTRSPATRWTTGWCSMPSAVREWVAKSDADFRSAQRLLRARNDPDFDGAFFMPSSAWRSS